MNWSHEISTLAGALAQTSCPAPAWYAESVWGNEPWRWAALLAVVAVSLILGRVAMIVLRRQGLWLERKGATWLALVLRSVAAPASLLIIAGGLYLPSQFIKLCPVDVPGFAGFQFSPGGYDLRWFWMAVCRSLAVLAAGWAMYRLVDVLELLMRRWAAGRAGQVDEQLLNLVRKLLRSVVVTVVLLFVAQNVFNWQITALLAGLGLGGLAMALAAQHALRNIFGSVAILADRPFGIGDFVKIGQISGTVVDIGFRSTRIRTPQGHLVNMPNAGVAESTVENISRRQFNYRELTLPLPVSTPPEKVAALLEKIRALLAAEKPQHHPDHPPRVFLSDIRETHLIVTVTYWFGSVDWWAFQEYNSRLNLELLKLVKDAG
jgi:MscS family membrane protein